MYIRTYYTTVEANGAEKLTVIIIHKLSKIIKKKFHTSLHRFTYNDNIVRAL